MSKTVRERKLDTPKARSKLQPNSKPYWHAIDTGVHQGYRRGLHGGAWVGRRYVGNGNYETETIAIADDHSAANGINILDFFQAQHRIREWAAQAKAPSKGPLTVNMALDAYFDRLEMESSRSIVDARRKAKKHIRPAFGETLVADLTRDYIAKWLADVAAKPCGGKVGAEAVPKPARPRRTAC